MNQITFGRNKNSVSISSSSINNTYNEEKKLSVFYKEYLQSKEKCDLKIVLNKKCIEKMHSVVFFCFATNFIKTNNDTIEICNDNISERILKLMIKFMYTGQVILNQNEFASFYYLTKNFGVKRLKNAVEQHISKNRSESYKTRNSSKKKNQINRKMLSTNKSSKDNSYTKSTNSKITDTLPTSEFINMQSSVTIPEINNPYNKFSNYCNKEYIHKNKVLPPLIASINQFSNENKNYGGNRNVKVTNSQKNKSSRKNTLSNSLNNTSFNSKRINSYRCKGG